MEEHGKTTYIYEGKSDYHRDVAVTVTAVQVDATITSIDTRAFYGYSSLRTINLPPTITTLGNEVFRDCSSLTSITLPSTITTLRYRSFSDCSSLTSITLPSTITILGEGVFSGCTSLVSITLPSNITTLGDYAFDECSSLVSVRLPENLTSISLQTFQGCVKLTTIEASSFSTATLDNSTLDGLKNMLISAGFYTSNPDDVIFDRRPDVIFDRRPMDKNLAVYYDWKKWARTRDVDDRFPLFTAAARCLKWSYMNQIFTSNMPVVNEIDELTGFPLFMLAATGPTSDIESVYNLLKECPSVINIMNNKPDSHSAEK